MKFTIQKNELLNAIQKVSNAISSRTVIPILTGMKIDVRSSMVILTGSNSDITIQSHILAEQENEQIISDIEVGTIILPLPHFPEIIRKIPEDTVEISVDENYKATIRSGKAVFTLNGQSSEEYPHIPVQQKEEHLSIPINDLKNIIKQTVFAVSTMETRPILTGINILLAENKLTFTGTDSHRLAMKSMEINNSEIDTLNIVIPGKSLLELSKILNDTDDHVKISIMKNQIVFFTDNIYFLSRLLSGNYPETARLIPTESKTTLHIDTRELIQTIERAALLSSSDQNNVIRLDTLENNVIEISSNSPEIGNVQEQLTVQSIDGEEIKISFSSKYMLDTLKTINSSQVIIHFTGAMRPFVIKALDDESILQLILPVRTF